MLFLLALQIVFPKMTQFFEFQYFNLIRLTLSYKYIRNLKNTLYFECNIIRPP